jgi:hypothetical protein
MENSTVALLFSPNKKTFERVTVNLPPSLAAELRQQVEDGSISMSEAIRRAVELDQYVRSEIAAGGKLFIQKLDGTMVEIKLGA